jgi:hypothetical protein
MLADDDRRHLAYAAAVWAVLFGVPHVYWAFGGDAGLGGHRMGGLLLALDFAAIVLAIVATGVGLALAHPVVPRLAIVGGWGAAALLGVRGAVGVIPGLLTLLTRHGEWPVFVAVFEVLFCTGGVLFGLATTAAQRSQAVTATAPRTSAPPARPAVPRRSPISSHAGPAAVTGSRRTATADAVAGSVRNAVKNMAYAGAEGTSPR